MQQTEAPGEGIVGLQISVAEMKGMLHQALSDQGQRITKVEADVTTIHGRLSDKGKMLATHTEQINSNRDRIGDLEHAQQGAVSKNTAVIACVLAAAGVILGIVDKIPWHGAAL